MTLTVLTAILFLAVGRGQPDAILGEWESEVRDGRMAFFKLGDIYAARLTWGTQIMEGDRKTSKKDLKNTDASLRGRDIVGITYITGLRYSGGEYLGGRIYNPLDGNTYDCKVVLKGSDLRLRAFKGVPLLGETRIWKRPK